MPHIIVKLYSGRSEELKKEAASKIAKAASEALGTDLDSVSVDFKEYDKENWKNEVYDKDIVPNFDNLYVKPKYEM